MSYRSHTAAPSRVFDHLYDPTYLTSDPKNVYKEDCIALTRSAPIHVYPVFKSMFSELNQDQRNCYAYQKNTLPFYPNIISNSSKMTVRRELCVTGADRTKFFSNAIGNTRTVNVGLMAEGSIESADDMQVIRYRSTSIQTTYRESSAQTRPWLPECFTNENIDEEMPEVVYIADMIDSISYPGLREIEIIERARKRRSWEMALPPIKEPEEIPSRVAAVEAFEWEEWIAREKDINECQQARLKLVADLIAKREKKHNENTNLKLENTRKRILNERKQQKDILIRNYQRSMRKLDLAQRKSSQNKKVDAVLSHFDRKMEYALPKIRLDTLTKKRTQIDYASDFEEKFKLLEKENSGLGDLEKYLKPIKRQLWIPKDQTKEIERGIWTESYLKKLHETLKQFRRKKYIKRKLPTCLIYDESAATSESSMSSPLQAPDDTIDNEYQDAVCVQKTIKGRAIQNMLYKGMEKFREVIEEAKETHSISAIQKLFPKDFTQQIENQDQILIEYKRIEDALKNDKKLQEELRKVESRDAGNLLSFLEKELQRLEGEKRAHALYLLAERERYTREAISMGKSEFEDQFRNDAITLYLENILIEGVNRLSKDEPREYVRKIAKKIDRKASKVSFEDEQDKFSDNSNTEEITSESSSKVEEIPDQRVVMELLKENMVPQIKNKIEKEQLISQQKKYLSQAHQELFRKEFEDSIKQAEYKICKDIFDEIIHSATSSSPTHPARKTLSENSVEAEELAGQIVEQILSEIINDNMHFSTESSENSSSNRSYDGDDSNMQSATSEINSSTEILANRVVENILNEIMHCSFSSTTSSTTTSE